MGDFPYKSKGFWGAIVVIISALYLLATEDYEQGIALLGIGLGLLGIRHKLEYAILREKNLTLS